MSSPIEIVAEAMRWEGTPYRHQAARRGVGCDCLGLVRGVWRALEGTEPFVLPPYHADPRRNEQPSALQAGFDSWLLKSQAPPEPGDVLLFRLGRNGPAHHCAIMLENGNFLHAQEHLGTVRAPLSGPWQRRLVANYAYPFSRLPQSSGTASISSSSAPGTL